MRSLLLSPHNDDEVLFASFLILKYQPDVLVCYAGHCQDGVTALEREEETKRALWRLGHTGTMTQSEIPDTSNHQADLRKVLVAFNEKNGPYDAVFAPAVELGGHLQHNTVGDLADEIWPGQVVNYTTYVRGEGRTISETEVKPERGWISRKLQAMAVYRSQIERPEIEYWFLDSTLREYIT